MNERIVIAVLGRSHAHGAKILDSLDIPVRKLYRKGCYVKREFGMDRNNCKIQLEITMKDARHNAMGMAMGGGRLVTGGGFGGGFGNIVYA